MIARLLRSEVGDMKRDLSAFAPLVLRLLLGFGFLYHGLPKLGDAHAGFVIMLDAIGIPAPGVMAWVVGIVEVVGGLALWAGVFTTIVSAVLIVELIVALFKVHLSHGFNFVNIVDASGPQFGMPGYEPVLLYIAVLLSFILAGPGKYSVKGWRAAKTSARPPMPAMASR
jgi:putative oxidoreductase